jgi:hypothetical protein
VGADAHGDRCADVCIETGANYEGRQWDQALGRLVQECALAGKTELFAYFLPYLAAPEESEIPYEEMVQRSHRPVITLRHELARLRARYRAILREEVRGTVLEPTDVNDELRYLCYALAAA